MTTINLNPTIEKIIEELKQAMAAQIEEEVAAKLSEQKGEVENESSYESAVEIDNNQDQEVQAAGSTDFGINNPQVGEDNQESVNLVGNEEEIILPNLNQESEDDNLNLDHEANSPELENNSIQAKESATDFNNQLTEPTNDLNQATSENQNEAFTLPDMPLPSGFDSQPSPFVPPDNQIGEINQVANEAVAAEEEPTVFATPAEEPKLEVELTQPQGENQFNAVEINNEINEAVVMNAVEAGEMNNQLAGSFEPKTEIKSDSNQNEQTNDFSTNTFDNQMPSVTTEAPTEKANQGFNKARGILSKVLKKDWSGK